MFFCCSAGNATTTAELVTILLFLPFIFACFGAVEVQTSSLHRHSGVPALSSWVDHLPEEKPNAISEEHQSCHQILFSQTAAMFQIP